MISGIQAWFLTRPTKAVEGEAPALDERAVAVLEATDGTAFIEIIRRNDGVFTHYVLAWSRFDDAGGERHHSWATFAPNPQPYTDSLDAAIDRARDDCVERKLVLEDSVDRQ